VGISSYSPSDPTPSIPHPQPTITEVEDCSGMSELSITDVERETVKLPLFGEVKVESIDNLYIVAIDRFSSFCQPSFFDLLTSVSDVNSKSYCCVLYPEDQSLCCTACGVEFPDVQNSLGKLKYHSLPDSNFSISFALFVGAFLGNLADWINKNEIKVVVISDSEIENGVCPLKSAFSPYSSFDFLSISFDDSIPNSPLFDLPALNMKENGVSISEIVEILKTDHFVKICSCCNHLTFDLVDNSFFMAEEKAGEVAEGFKKWSRKQVNKVDRLQLLYSLIHSYISLPS